MRNYDAIKDIRVEGGACISRAFDVGYCQGYEDGVRDTEKPLIDKTCQRFREPVFEEDSQDSNSVDRSIDVSKVIMAARAAKYASQREFAKVAGMSNATVSYLEDSRCARIPTLEVILKLEKYLGLNRYRLVGKYFKLIESGGICHREN